MDATLPRIAPSRLRTAPAAGPPRALCPAAVEIPAPHEPCLRRDEALLRRIAGLAYDAFVDAEQPAAAWAATVATLEADLDRRFPAADMAVLDRYGLANRYGRVIVLFNTPYRRPIHVDVAARLAPSGGMLYSGDEPAMTAAGDGAPLPGDLQPFFMRTRHLRDGRHPFITGVLASIPKSRQWSDLEALHPIVGVWLAAQRAGARA